LPVTYTLDNGNGYSTTVTITASASGATVAYEVKPTAGGNAIYTGNYTFSVSTTTTGSYNYDGTASWNLPAPTSYSGSSTTHLSTTDLTGGLSAMSGTITATAGAITATLNLSNGAFSGQVQQGSTAYGSFSGNTTSGVVYTAN